MSTRIQRARKLFLIVGSLSLIGFVRANDVLADDFLHNQQSPSSSFGFPYSDQSQHLAPSATPNDSSFSVQPASGWEGIPTSFEMEPPEPSPDVDSLLKRISDLEKSEEKRAKSEAKKKDEEKKKKEEEQRKKTDWCERAKEKWTVKLGGHVQTDYINWASADASIVETANAPGPQDYFAFRRLRLVADGTGYGVYDFRLQMTLEPDTIGDSPVGATTGAVKDAYMSVNEIPLFGRMRIGHFFVPFSLEQVTNDTNNIFVERSIPTQGIFAADREVGIAFYNCTEEKRVTWTSGMFFDSVSETTKKRVDDNQGLRLSGRLTCLPVYDASCDGRYLVHTGVGILHTDDQDNRVRFRARPQIQEGPRLISSPVLNADSFTTGNLEFASVMGPVTLQSEAFLSQVHMISVPEETVSGAYAHLSYFLTGENRQFEMFGQHGAQFGRNTPKANFLWTDGFFSPGAIELKMRWSNLNLDNVNGGQYNDFTLGTNWYWSDRTRWMFDWIHPITNQQTTFGSTRSNILAMRFDFNW